MNYYKKAMADYDEVVANPNSSLQAMQDAYEHARQAAAGAQNASLAEAAALPSLAALKQKAEVADSTYKRLKGSGKDYEAELKAESAAKKAWDTYNDLVYRTAHSIEQQVNGNRVEFPDIKARHMALIRAKYEAEAEERKKAQAQPSTGTKTSCAPATGLTGAMENVACQEQHSGSGH
jgi:hypothetical protein